MSINVDPIAGIDVSKDKLIVYFQGKFYETLSKLIKMAIHE
ncbi:hypothetical protein [Sulfolobus sp. S-194]|nr:hypothetical protein [Sulfolobus sp. S-194]